MKKHLALLLAILMLAALFAGCTKGEPAQGSNTPASGTTGSGTSAGNSGSAGTAGTEPVESDDTISFPLAEKMTYSFWVGLHAVNLECNPTLNDVPTYQELERRTNVHIDFVHPTYGSEREAYGIMLSTGDITDVFPTSYYNGGAPALYAQDFIMDLSDAIPKYMHTYYSLLTADPNILRDAKQDSGQLLTLNTLNDQKTLPWKGLGIRADLVENAGLSLPTTYDEWETALTAFRDMGLPVPLTLAKSGTSDQNFQVGFGCAERLYQQNGQVKYGPAETGYRDYLELMADWFSKGLIYKDFISATGAEGYLGYPVDEVFNRGEYGGGLVVSSAIGSQRYDTGIAPEYQYYETLTPPTINKGDTIGFSNSAGSGRVGGALAINSQYDVSKLPILLSYFDYCYTDEGSILANFGIEGESYEIGADGKPHYTDIIDASAHDGVTKFHIYNYAFLTFPFLSQDKERIQNRPAEIIELQSRWILSGTDFGVLPSLTLSEAETADASAKLNDINTYVDEMTTRIIMGYEPVSSWENFANEMQKMGLEDVLTAYQNAFSRYLAR